MNDTYNYELIREQIAGTLESQSPIEEKSRWLDSLFRVLLNEYTDPFLIPFNTIFAQLAFAISQLELDSNTSFILHFYRKNFLNKIVGTDDFDELQLKTGALDILAAAVFKIGHPFFKKEIAFCYSIANTGRDKEVYYSYRRFLIQSAHLEDNLLRGIDEETGELTRVILDPVQHENLIANLKFNLPYYTLPVIVSLIGVHVIDEAYSPEMVVLHPDFLMDVTSVAECFGYNHVISNQHFIKKFKSREMTDPIFKGFLANYFLDELTRDPDISFAQIQSCIFKLNPIYLATKENSEIKIILQDSERHFNNLQQIVRNQFPLQNISLEHIMIEPSFYAPAYGLQGRLDLLTQDHNIRTIVELKSGKIFKPNSYGINHSHYIQTLLYNLLINPNRKKQQEIRTYILYSAENTKGLRYAPMVASQQAEAILVRNNLASIEHRLSRIDANGNDITGVFGILEELMECGLSGFLLQDLVYFKTKFESLTPLKQKYLKAYIGFISRELFMSKHGVLRDQQTQGQSALWNNAYTEKNNNFAILGFLTIDMEQIVLSEGLITLHKSKATNALADFRPGDIIILYGTDEAGDFEWAFHQVFKGSLISNTPDEVTIRLRNPQLNRQLFESGKWWNIEKDMMDSSFTSQMSAVGSFISTSTYKQDLLLGIQAPAMPADDGRFQLEDFIPYERDILSSALYAQDYFLIWGPPGTGKTSYIARHLIEQITNCTQRPLLVLAYTNRAVDELCAAIQEISPELSSRYVRIGSRYSTDAAYTSQLLDEKIAGIDDRKSLREFIHSQKIFCGTVSSLIGKPELFKLVHFEYAIIDESSQVLDPQLISLLTKVEKFIMIGDHKQLPAVVTQPAEWTQVTDAELNETGIFDLRMSLFERLYIRAVSKKWSWCYGILNKQGRMHRDIMSFPARYFYDGQLDILLPHQEDTLVSIDSIPKGHNGYLSALNAQRVLFIPSPVAHLTFSKMNNQEANIILSVLRDLHTLYGSQSVSLSKKTIGIITPFRSQIINIRHHLQQLDFELDCVIDTVERFQGGACDIIIISMVVSNPDQMQMICSGGEGIDRKMNVALTRARERLIMVGNPEILSLSPFYKSFIDEYGIAPDISIE